MLKAQVYDYGGRPNVYFFVEIQLRHYLRRRKSINLLVRIRRGNLNALRKVLAVFEVGDFKIHALTLLPLNYHLLGSDATVNIAN